LAVVLALWLPLGAADFAILHLKVVEGEGMLYAPGSRATRGITVEVTDETGRPVPGVSVSFQLPDTGPSGVFLNGGRADIATTGDDGRAAVWGMRWNKTTGTVSVRITAAKDGIRAGILSTQTIDATAPSASDRSVRGGRSRLLIVTLAVAAAAGAGIAAGTMRGSKSTEPPAAAGISIGAPTVIIGAPQ
jgi:hypothetical protein